MALETDFMTQKYFRSENSPIFACYYTLIKVTNWRKQKMDSPTFRI